MRRRVCSGRRASVFSRRLFGEATFEQGFALRRFAGNARFGAVVCSLRHSSGKTRIVFGLTGRSQIIRSFPASAKVGRNSGVPGLMRIRYAIFAVLRIPSRGNRACRLLPEPAVRSLRRGPETAIPSFAARRNKGRVFAAAAFAPPDGARKAAECRSVRSSPARHRDGRFSLFAGRRFGEERTVRNRRLLLRSFADPRSRPFRLARRLSPRLPAFRSGSVSSMVRGDSERRIFPFSRFVLRRCGGDVGSSLPSAAAGGNRPEHLPALGRRRRLSLRKQSAKREIHLACLRI